MVKKMFSYTLRRSDNAGVRHVIKSNSLWKAAVVKSPEIIHIKLYF